MRGVDVPLRGVILTRCGGLLNDPARLGQEVVHDELEEAGARRSRRTFSVESKLEAVCLMEERRAAGTPDLFPGHGQLPGAEAEVRRLQREKATLRQERDLRRRTVVFVAEESVKYPCIARYRGEFPLRLMCARRACRLGASTRRGSARPARGPSEIRRCESKCGRSIGAAGGATGRPACIGSWWRRANGWARSA